MKREWEQFEAHVNELLELSSTVHSGCRWHDPGDGVDRSHMSENAFALIQDSKFTQRNSFSIKLAPLEEWREKAIEMGKRFIMPIRLWPKEHSAPSDYVLIGLDDFAELIDKAKPKKLEWWGGPADRTWLDYDEMRRYGNG